MSSSRFDQPLRSRARPPLAKDKPQLRSYTGLIVPCTATHRCIRETANYVVDHGIVAPGELTKPPLFTAAAKEMIQWAVEDHVRNYYRVALRLARSYKRKNPSEVDCRVAADIVSGKPFCTY